MVYYNFIEKYYGAQIDHVNLFPSCFGMLLSKNSQSFHIVSLESCGKLVKHLQMLPNAVEVLVGTLEFLLPKLGKASLAPILL